MRQRAKHTNKNQVSTAYDMGGPLYNRDMGISLLIKPSLSMTQSSEAIKKKEKKNMAQNVLIKTTERALFMYETKESSKE